jgi:hypothetical protein
VAELAKRVPSVSQQIATAIAEFEMKTLLGRSSDLRRKAYTACTAKMARTIYGLIKHQQFYRAYHEAAVPQGR